MLADFDIARLSNDMKIAVRKNNLEFQIWYRSFDPVKPNGVTTKYLLYDKLHVEPEQIKFCKNSIFFSYYINKNMFIKWDIETSFCLFFLVGEV